MVVPCLAMHVTTMLLPGSYQVPTRFLPCCSLCGADRRWEASGLRWGVAGIRRGSILKGMHHSARGCAPSDMSPTPRHLAAPMGLAGVLFGFTCYKHAAPTELAASVVPAGTWQPYGRRPRFETLGYCHLSSQTGSRSLSAVVLPPQFLAVLDTNVRAPVTR